VVAQLIDLFKLRIGLFMAFTALAGYAVTPGLVLSGAEMLLLALVVLGASAAAGAFNQFMERDLDALMPRTRNRPFVTGAVSHGQGWLWIIAATLVVSMGLAFWLFNAAVAVHLFLGAFFYGVVYTMWLKRRTPLNIVIGGVSGSFAVMAGSAAADPLLTPTPLLLAAVLFLWTPPHFWALAIAQHDDYAAAGVPMLPVVKGDEATARIILLSTILLVAVSLLPVLFTMGAVYLFGALVGGGYFIYRSYLLTLDTGRANAMRCFFASLIQLACLIVAAVLDVQFAG
jgi:protoheme IX farnesyltransferase